MDGNGTTFGSITKDTLFEMKVVIPRRDQIKSFEEWCNRLSKNQSSRARKPRAHKTP